MRVFLAKLQQAPFWICLTLFSLLLRAPGLWIPILDVDESQFAGYANTLLAGGLPFVDSVDTKPLGIYLFFQIIFSLFGKNNMAAVHGATAIIVAITAIYCGKIARKIFSERSGVYAALLYVIFSTCYLPKFISTSISIIMMLPLTMCIWHFLQAEHSQRKRDYFLSGILFGIAFLFKYQAGITLVVIAFFSLFFQSLYLRGDFLPVHKKAFPFFLLGGVCVGLAFSAYLSAIGVWNDFVFFSFNGSVAYMEAGSNTADFFRRLFMRGGSFVAFTLLVWFFAMRHILQLIKHIFTSLEHQEKRAGEYFIFFWFLFSGVAVVAGGRFFGHYFIQLLPALVILAAPQVEIFLQRFTTYPLPTFARWRYGLFWVALIFPAVVAFQLRVFSPWIYQHFQEDHAELYRPIGEYIREHSTPTDKIFVWGFATPIYFFAERDAASRFLWTDWLTGRIAGSPTAKDSFFDTSSYVTKGSWEMLMSDLRKNRPLYIADTSPANLHEYGKYPLLNYPQLVEFLDHHYVLESKVAEADLYRRLDAQGITP